MVVHHGRPIVRERYPLWFRSPNSTRVPSSWPNVMQPHLDRVGGDKLDTPIPKPCACKQPRADRIFCYDGEHRQASARERRLGGMICFDRVGCVCSDPSGDGACTRVAIHHVPSARSCGRRVEPLTPSRLAAGCRTWRVLPLTPSLLTAGLGGGRGPCRGTQPVV